MLMNNIRQRYSNEYGQRERADGATQGHGGHINGGYAGENYRSYQSIPPNSSAPNNNAPPTYSKMTYSGISGLSKPPPNGTTSSGSHLYSGGHLPSSLLPGTIQGPEESSTHRRTPPPPLISSTELDHGSIQRTTDPRRNYLSSLTRPHSAPHRPTPLSTGTGIVSGSTRTFNDGFQGSQSARGLGNSQPTTPVKQPTQAWAHSTTPAIREAVSQTVEQRLKSLLETPVGAKPSDGPPPARPPPKTPPVLPRRGVHNKGYLHEDGEVMHVPPAKPRDSDTDWVHTNGHDTGSSSYVPSRPSDRLSAGRGGSNLTSRPNTAPSSERFAGTSTSQGYPHSTGSSQGYTPSQGSSQYHASTPGTHPYPGGYGGGTGSYPASPSMGIRHRAPPTPPGPSTSTSQSGQHPPKYQPPPEYHTNPGVLVNGDSHPAIDPRDTNGDLRNACSRLYNRDLPSSASQAPGTYTTSTPYTTGSYTSTSYTSGSYSSSSYTPSSTVYPQASTPATSSSQIHPAYRPSQGTTHPTQPPQSPRGTSRSSYGGISLQSHDRSSPMGQSSSNPSHSASTSPGSPTTPHKPPGIHTAGSAPSSQGSRPSSARRSGQEPSGRPPLAPPPNVPPHRPGLSISQGSNSGGGFTDNGFNAKSDASNRNYVSDTYDVSKQTEKVSKPAEALIRHQRQRSSGGGDRASLGTDRTSINSDRLSIGRDRSLERAVNSYDRNQPESLKMARLSIAASAGSSMDGGDKGRPPDLPPVPSMANRGPVSQSAPMLNQLANKWPLHSTTTPTTTTSGVGSGLDGFDNDQFDDSSDSLRSTTPPLPALSPSNTPPMTPPESPSAIHRQLQQQRSPGKLSWHPGISNAPGTSSHLPTGSASHYIPQPTPDVVTSTSGTTRKKPNRKQVAYAPGKNWDRRNGQPRPGYKGINPSKGNFRNNGRFNGLSNVAESDDIVDHHAMDGDASYSDDEDYGDSTYTSEVTSQRELLTMRRQMEGLESMYGEVLRMMGVDKSSEYGAPGSRRSISSTSSIGRSRGVRIRHSHSHRHRSKEYKQINKRFQRLESHVVTLARSVAHLSSEMRSQNALFQQVDEMKHEITQLKEAAQANTGNRAGGQEFDRFRGWVPALTNPKRVKKLTKFFGQEPPWLHIFLRKLGYDRYIDNFESEKIGMLELPCLSEERLQKIGIPMGPRVRILQEAQMCFRQENFNIYIV